MRMMGSLAVPAPTRRGFLASAFSAGLAAAAPARGLCAAAEARASRRAGSGEGSDGASPSGAQKALIAITLDLEMSRNFPTWDQTHWDFDKGNLDTATKRYATEAARRV